MLCDFCHVNEGYIFLEQVAIDNKSNKICICKNCAQSRGIDSNVTPINNKKLLDVINEYLANKSKKTNEDEKKLCSACGRSLALIKRTGITGCPECYAVFNKEIRQLLNDFGVKDEYIGSLPKRLSGFRNVLTDRLDIQLKLEESIKKEDYEKAAVYRDFLHALEKNSVSDGNDYLNIGNKKDE